MLQLYTNAFILQFCRLNFRRHFSNGVWLSTRMRCKLFLCESSYVNLLIFYSVSLILSLMAGYGSLKGFKIIHTKNLNFWDITMWCNICGISTFAAWILKVKVAFWMRKIAYSHENNSTDKDFMPIALPNKLSSFNSATLLSFTDTFIQMCKDMNFATFCNNLC